MGGTTTVYAYDGDGKRVSTTVGGVTTRYVYDVSGTLPMLLDDGTRKYVWGQGLAYTVDNSGNVRVPHTDGLGSVRALSDSTNSVVQAYQTDEFGVPGETMGTLSQPLQYTGEQRDGETGLVSLRARVYDPQVGRFLQRDSVAKSRPGIGGWNRFAYAGNNPVNQTDSSGHVDVKPGGYSGGDDGITWDDPRTMDTPCASRGQGPGTEGMGGYIINAVCLETPLGTFVGIPVQVFGVTVYVPVGVFAKGPKGDAGGDGSDRRRPWEISKERTDQSVVHATFGRIWRDIKTGLWWARDRAGHGGSAWKVFQEEATGLRHFKDADMYGTYFEDKHRGPVGEFIPWSELRRVP